MNAIAPRIESAIAQALTSRFAANQLREQQKLNYLKLWGKHPCLPIIARMPVPLSNFGIFFYLQVP
ncbi:MAG: hypothetical protein QNJ47_01230 [Nostocaceae cyanobacterium]|nr:hypothetical protein [Nostocaceae cyanobacterium]